MNTQYKTMLKGLTRSPIVRSSAIYTLSTIINSAIPFLLLPVLTRYLTPADYGVVAMFSVLLGFVSPFLGVSIHGAISVRYFDKAETDLPRYVGNGFILIAISTAIVSCLLWLFAKPISGLTAFPREWLGAVLVIAVGQVVVLVLLTLWQVRNKAASYGFFQILQTACTMTLTIILIAGLGYDWRGSVMAQLVVLTLFGFAAFFVLRKNGWVRFSYDRNSMRHALWFGIPLIPHALGGMLITQTDRVFITNMVGITDTGIYTVGFQLAMIVELCTSSFNRAYVPWLYGHLRDNDPAMKIKIVKLTYIYFSVVMIFALALSLVMPWFLSFFVGKTFAGAAQYTPWIAVGFAFNGMYYMVANYIFYAGKTYLLSGVTFFTALLNIVLNYVLIKKNGAVGAAQASMVAFFMSFVLTWMLSAKVSPMPWNLRRAEQ